MRRAGSSPFDHPTRIHTLALAIRRPDRCEIAIRVFDGVPLEIGGRSVRTRAWLRPGVETAGRGSSVFTIH